MRIKLSDYVWAFLSNQGIKHVFMFPGGGAMHLLDSLGRNENIQNITLLHEQACAMAAETYARISYNMGAVLVTTGPGGTNAITGVAAAWLESTPIIVISGQAKRSDLKGDSGVRQKGNQEIGITEIVSSITKYAVLVDDPKDIRFHLEKAVFEAKNGRPGPVWIDIPLDVQGAMIDDNNLRRFLPTQVINYPISKKNIKDIVALLKKSVRPVIIAGQGVERRNGKETFRKLVNTLGIPVLTSWIGTELLEYDSIYNFGKPGMVAPRYSNFAVQNSDLIIAIGTRLDSAMIGYNPADFGPYAEKVIVDIDLAEINKFTFTIKKKIVGDATEFIRLLLEEVTVGWDKEKYIHWLEQCKLWKNEYPVVLKSFKESKNLVNPYYFFDILSCCLNDDDVIIPGSSGAIIDVFWLCFKNRKTQRVLATGSLGSMGYGVPAAIGACLASEKRTICIEGDGSFQLNIQELASISGMNLPIKIFINDNGGYLSIMNMQRNHFNAHYVGAEKSSGLYLPDIGSVAKAYGFKVFTIYCHDDMETMIHNVLNTEGPALCIVKMNDDVQVQPRVMSRVMPDGTMQSGKLNDMYPFIE